MLYPALVLVITGCTTSLGHHIEVYSGQTAPRMFPLIRYWAEYSSQDLKELAATPWVGIPGILPIGYCLDVCTDVMLSPIDTIVVL